MKASDFLDPSEEQAGTPMWIEKLAHGIVELDTPIGPRYLEPTFLERAYLIWTFRNFVSLPHQVLRRSEQQLIDRLCIENRFVSLPANGTDRPVIGRVERRPPALDEPLPAPKSATRSRASAAEQRREAASA